ncbi:methylated-DNA--[protein]-cysteine S-methyltransferase [Candidatus Poribacteria bacterium]|nr:methylated-DNA--[protein]-cysteine S-methyltransferase [Candidatus Poribacteria bacterium]
MPLDYVRIEKSLRFLAQNFQNQPSLPEVAAAAGLSEYHFQRLFAEWAGVSPKKFVEYLTVEYAKGLLASQEPVLETAFQTGLSGPGRLHDHFITIEAMTPGEYGRGGAGLTIRWGIAPSPFGKCLVARTERGICGIEFVDEESSRTTALLRDRWPRASFVEDSSAAEELAGHLFGNDPGSGPSPIQLHVRGTNFQIQVWKALLNIPAGRACTYGSLAAGLGKPGGSRAVGQALARNPAAVLIPCHRVIRSLGVIGQYRWGEERKRLILAWEGAAAGRLIPAPVPA